MAAMPFPDLVGYFDDEIKSFGGGAKPPVSNVGPAGPGTTGQFVRPMPSGPGYAAQFNAGADSIINGQKVAAGGVGGAPPGGSGEVGKVAGFGAKTLPVLRGIGGAAGIIGGALSAEDMAKNGVGVGNSLGLAAGVTGTAAMIPALAPVAGPAALLTAAPAVGYAVGQNMPDAVTTRLASLAGRFGIGAKYVGGAPDATDIRGPATLEYQAAQGAKPATPGPATIDGNTGKVIDAASQTSLEVPPAAAAPISYSVPSAGGIESGAQSFVPAGTPTGVTGGQAPIGANRLGINPNAARNNTAQTVVDTDGNRVITNFSDQSPAQAPVSYRYDRQGNPIPVYAPPGAQAGYGSRPHEAAPINPKTGVPYAASVAPVLPRDPSSSDVWNYMANASRYVTAAGREKQLHQEKVADRAVQVTNIKEQGAIQRQLMKEMGSPFAIKNAVGAEAQVHPAAGRSYTLNDKGEVQIGALRRSAPEYSDAVAKQLLQNPKYKNASINEKRQALKQTWPDQDIPSHVFR